MYRQHFIVEQIIQRNPPMSLSHNRQPHHILPIPPPRLLGLDGAYSRAITSNIVGSRRVVVLITVTATTTARRPRGVRPDGLDDFISLLIEERGEERMEEPFTTAPRWLDDDFGVLHRKRHGDVARVACRGDEAADLAFDVALVPVGELAVQDESVHE